ncbi:MAG: AAA family ATPase, partial [Candidatus Electryoneaceae bacterium]|nr:AAA family ATPase [Candidatus Electryoneaceae bacterium]
GGVFHISRPDIYKMENTLQQRFKSSIGANPHFTSVKNLEELVDKEASNLNEDQRQAVLTALSSRIVVITGGAGSGKTFTIGALTNIYLSQNKSVILTAPTGKAAMRMQETIGVQASTIHRLLQYNGVTFEIEEPLQADLIVVDEVSMVDITLAYHLFQNIDLEKTAVVLVGDHNQLLSIGPGNILRDLIETRLVPCVILNQIVRQAGILKANSTAILQGKVHKTAPESTNGRGPWYLIEQFTDALDIQRFIVDLYENILSERLGFDLLRDVQLLTPTKKGPLGTVELNTLLQQVIQKKLFGVNVIPPKPGRRPSFYPHDRVIQIKNNYTFSVFNGSLGIIEAVNSDSGLRIDFDGNIVEIEPDSQEKNDVALAYALTIHKVQGSEFPCTISIIHKAHTFMHNKNLFYTAVTRSQQCAVIIGDRWGLRNCAKKRLMTKRRTLLSMMES